jgi:hypothetical protein
MKACACRPETKTPGAGHPGVECPGLSATTLEAARDGVVYDETEGKLELWHGTGGG